MSAVSKIGEFLTDRRGGIAIVGGLAVPVLVLAGAATVEYGHIAGRKSQLQKAADAAALSGAQQLRLSKTPDSVVASVVRDVVAQNAPPPDGVTTDVSSLVQDKRSAVQVSLTENVKSVIGKVLTLPSSTISVQATAKISGNTKLCLLTLDGASEKALYLEQNSLITAQGCAIVSDSKNPKGLTADSNARLSASMICSSGGVANNGAFLSPVPVTDCPPITDPLASQKRPTSGLCTGLEKATKISKSRTVYGGTFCGGMEISGNAKVYFAPGIYIFNNGPLLVTNTATLTGQNVGLYFTGSAGGIRFDPNTTIDLTAPRDGTMAGLLFAEDRTLLAALPLPLGPGGALPPLPLGSPPMREYQISSNNAANLLGTFYLPNGRLIIDASKPVAAMSAYTVIVARQINVNSGPNLVLNSNYGSTDIPVPDGVGPKTGNVSLTQ